MHRSSSVATASQGVSNELVRKSLVGASSVSSFPSSRFVHLAFAILRRGRVGASKSVQDDRRERRRVRPRHRGGISPKELVQRSLPEIPRPERPSVAGDPSSSAPLLPRSPFEPLRRRPFELSRREQSQVDERPVERLVQKFIRMTRRTGDVHKLSRDGLDRSPPLAQFQRVPRLHVEQVAARTDHLVVVRRGGEDLDEPTRPLRRLVNHGPILRVCARQDEVIANAPPPSREGSEVDRGQRRAQNTARPRRTQEPDRRRAQRNLPREGVRADARGVDTAGAARAVFGAKKVQRGSHRGVVDVLREQRRRRAAEAVTDGSFDESRRGAGHLGLAPRDQPPEQPDARRDEPGAGARGGGIANVTFSFPFLPADAVTVRSPSRFVQRRGAREREADLDAPRSAKRAGESARPVRVGSRGERRGEGDDSRG